MYWKTKLIYSLEITEFTWNLEEIRSVCITVMFLLKQTFNLKLKNYKYFRIPDTIFFTNWKSVNNHHTLIVQNCIACMSHEFVISLITNHKSSKTLSITSTLVDVHNCLVIVMWVSNIYS